MRHRNHGRTLNRAHKPRLALLRTLAKQLLEHGRIVTTDAKAKTLQAFVEPLLTKAIAGGQHNLKLVDAELQDRALLKKVTDEIVPALKGRPGGYTTLVRMAPRRGDAVTRSAVQLNVPLGVEAPAAEG